jgi:hypothetical protein
MEGKDGSGPPTEQDPVREKIDYYNDSVKVGSDSRPASAARSQEDDIMESKLSTPEVKAPDAGNEPSVRLPSGKAKDSSLIDSRPTSAGLASARSKEDDIMESKLSTPEVKSHIAEGKNESDPGPFVDDLKDTSLSVNRNATPDESKLGGDQLEDYEDGRESKDEASPPPSRPVTAATSERPTSSSIANPSTDSKCNASYLNCQ